MSLLAENHCSALFSSSFALLNKLDELVAVIWNVQSSAKSKVNKSVAFVKSLMKNRKSKGPRQLP